MLCVSLSGFWHKLHPLYFFTNQGYLQPFYFTELNFYCMIQLFTIKSHISLVPDSTAYVSNASLLEGL